MQNIRHRLNPKALPRHQLLGCLNLDTREWADGVLTAAARKVGIQGGLVAHCVHAAVLATAGSMGLGLPLE